MRPTRPGGRRRARTPAAPGGPRPRAGDPARVASAARAASSATMIQSTYGDRLGSVAADAPDEARGSSAASDAGVVGGAVASAMRDGASAPSSDGEQPASANTKTCALAG